MPPFQTEISRLLLIKQTSTMAHSRFPSNRTLNVFLNYTGGGTGKGLGREGGGGRKGLAWNPELCTLPTPGP